MTIRRSFLLLVIVPACATDAPDDLTPFGKEPARPCAATGYRVDSPNARQHYRYQYDERGNETLRVVHTDPYYFVEARFAEYDGDELVREEIRTNTDDTVRVIRLDRGRPVDEQTTYYFDGTEARARATSTWNFEDSPPSLMERRQIEGLYAGQIMRYRPLVDELGFVMTLCAADGSECTDFDFVGPYEYVGDERSWTTLRAHVPGEPTMLLGERTFDANGLVLSSTEYVPTIASGAGDTPEMSEKTVWRRDADGTLRGWDRQRPGEPTYRYEAQYASCPAQ